MKNSEKSDLYELESDVRNFRYEAQTLHEHSPPSFQRRRVLVSAFSHRTGHREVEWLAGRDCGVAVVCALKRRGIKCGSTADEREAGVVDGPGEWAFIILPIPWEIGGTEEAVRERVLSTGIGPTYVRN